MSLEDTDKGIVDLFIAVGPHAHCSYRFHTLQKNQTDSSFSLNRIDVVDGLTAQTCMPQKRY
jgi:hypothetical protein